MNAEAIERVPARFVALKAAAAAVTHVSAYKRDATSNILANREDRGVVTCGSAVTKTY